MKFQLSALHGIHKSLALAALYFIAGKLALLLAIPPGYATPVWPSAGIALAGILVFGFRVWPGILLGSFLVNLPAPMSSTSLVPVLSTLPIPLAISVGSVLQAGVGALLIRRFIGFPHAFDRPANILKTMALGGPVSCVINATFGVTTLFVAGTLDPIQILHSWWTWWLGDTIGVLVIIPVVSAWGLELQQTGLRTRILVGLPLAIGVLLTVTLFLDVRAGEWRNAQMEFERRSEIIAQAMEKTLESKLEILQSIVALFSSMAHVDRQEFHAFVEPIFQRHQGLSGLSWNVRLLGSQRAEYEKAARLDGYPHFRVLQQNDQGQLIEAADREEYVVVYYIEPYSTNHKALGYDLASDPTRAQVLAEARDTGHILATPPLTLVQETEDQAGFLFFAPIYSKNLRNPTVEQRRKNLHSFVSGVFRADKMFEEALKPFEREAINYRIFDVSDSPVEANPLHTRMKSVPHQSPFNWGKSRLFWDTSVDIAGRQWTIEFWPNSTYHTSELSEKPRAVLTGGLIFTSLIGALLLTIAGRNAMVGRLVETRTIELSESNRRLKEEITERERAEQALQSAHNRLESRVEERTLELKTANQNLEKEIQSRKEAQEAYKRVEQELLRKQKLDSIAILAGGIAHDFNNLLTALSGNLVLAKLEPSLSNKTRSFLEEAEQTVSRASGLTNKLLTFAKGGAPVKKQTNLLSLIRSTCERALAGSRVQCDFFIDELRPSHIDIGQIEQVVANLMRNAIQAMPEGGEIKIRAENLWVESGSVAFLEPGLYVRISFIDHGKGIPAENLSRIFDPYFTTKPGSNGLGLATAYSIIRRHEGIITVLSELGQGSTFRVYLPAILTEGPIEDNQDVEIVNPGQGRVLIMDDEKMIRQVVGEFVTQLGYQVETVSDGVAAVSRYRDALMSGNRFDAVILDLTVPRGLGGKEAIQLLLEIDPEVKAIVSSGYSEDPILSNFTKYGFSDVIAKPFSFKALGETLQKMLRKDGGSHNKG